jgi:hypothetical protein
MSIVSHLSLTMVPLMIGLVFSQTETLQKAWHKTPSVNPGSYGGSSVNFKNDDERLGSENTISSPKKDGETRTMDSLDNLR